MRSMLIFGHTGTDVLPATLALTTLIEWHTYDGIYTDEIKVLWQDYADLWEALSDLLKKLSAVMTI